MPVERRPSSELVQQDDFPLMDGPALARDVYDFRPSLVRSLGTNAQRYSMGTARTRVASGRTARGCNRVLLRSFSAVCFCCAANVLLQVDTSRLQAEGEKPVPSAFKRCAASCHLTALLSQCRQASQRRYRHGAVQGSAELAGSGRVPPASTARSDLRTHLRTQCLA